MEEVPPGQVPTRMTPIASSGGSRKSLVSRNASRGIRVNCAMEPMITSLGRENTTLKSPGFKVRPMPNMTIPSSVFT